MANKFLNKILCTDIKERKRSRKKEGYLCFPSHGSGPGPSPSLGPTFYLTTAGPNLYLPAPTLNLYLSAPGPQFVFTGTG